ncbi:hypothetical protein G6F56_007484 [Rhizopus delemar]|nr:hypothetical protein G6F56_007484 [Rhizopus delemar]
MASRTYHKQNDNELVKRIIQKFGKECVLILGNWSAPNVKYQEPTRNAGLINMFKKRDLNLYLIDEYKTSSTYPTYEGDIKQKFKTIKNPRPYRLSKNPTVICHGLMRCEKVKCSKNEHKLWNRDLAAVLNFRKILMSLRETGKRPITLLETKCKFIPSKLSLRLFHAGKNLSELASVF